MSFSTFPNDSPSKHFNFDSSLLHSFIEALGPQSIKNKTEKVFSDPKRVGLTICHSKLISTLNERISYSKVSIDYPNVNCVFLMLTNPSC